MTLPSLIELVPASPGHVGRIAARMRSDDIAECAAFGRTPKSALRLGLMGSSHVLTAKLNGRPEAMMGIVVTSAISGEGTPWMLGSDEIYRHPKAMLTLGPHVLALWGRDSSKSWSNLVSAENARSIRFLRRIGFHIGDELTMVGGMSFLTFTMER